MKIATLLSICCLLLAFTTSAQRRQIFKAGATVGVNWTQVDGDYQFGYDKKGLNFGLRGGVIWTKNFETAVELLYNYKGSKPDNNDNGSYKRQIFLDMHYAEVPFLLKYYFKRNPDGFYAWNIFSGISYGRLLRSNTSILLNGYVTDTVQTRIINQIGYKSSDWSFIIGFSKHFSSRLGINFRSVVSLGDFYYNSELSSPVKVTTAIRQTRDQYVAFRHFFLSLNVFYDFIAPKNKPDKKLRRAIVD